MQLLRNHFYLLITRLHFYSSVNETSHNFVDSQISSAGFTSVIHLRIVFECFTFTKEKLSIVIVYLTILRYTTEDKQTEVACSALLDVWMQSLKWELMTHSQIVWDRYSALYNLFMHLKSSKTENLEALLLLLCPALTKIKTCVGLGSNPATDPQVCLTPRGCLFRGKSKGYNNVFGLLRPTLQHLLLGPPSLTS